jgi:hypothetical protein
MKYFIPIVLVVAIIVSGFAFYQLKKQQPQQEPIPTPKPQLIGGQKDDHGCLSGAGYSWCNSKNKCLRVWEEGCPSPDDANLIKTALFKKNNWPDDSSLKFVLTENDGNYAKGTVNGNGGGGYFFAAKQNGDWVIVADGNGIIQCSALTDFPKFPTSYIPTCFDSTTQKTVTR